MKPFVFVLGCLLAPFWAQATISCGTPVSVTQTAGGTSAGLNTTGASLIIGGTTGYIYPIQGVTDSLGNSWQYGSAWGNNGGFTQSQIPFVSSPTTGSSQTFTIGTSSLPAGLYGSGVFLACSGTATSYPLESQAGIGSTGSSSTPFTVGSLTPNQSGDICVSTISTSGITSFSASISGGFSTPVIVPGGAGNSAMAFSYLITTSTTACNPQWTVSTGSVWSGANAIFAVASATPPVQTGPSLIWLAGATVPATGGTGGSGGAPKSAKFYWPGELAWDSHGNLCWADINNNRIWCLNNQLTTQTLYGMSIGAGDAAIIAGNGTLGCSDNATATSGEMAHPVGLAIDSSNNLYIADQQCNAIRKITTAGVLSTVAGTLTTPGCSHGTFSGDGALATSAGMSCPQGVAIDPNGNIIASDTNNYRIRAINTQGTTQTILGVSGIGSGDIQTVYGNGSIGTVYPLGSGYDPSGNYYVADYFSYRVLKITSSGSESVFAGTGSVGYGPAGPATSASLNHVYDVKADNTGAVYIADSANGTVWVVRSGTINALAGNYSLLGTGGGYTGIGGAANLSGLAANKNQGVGPVGIALNSTGILAISDTGNNRIDEVALQICSLSCLIGGSIKGGRLY
jgi:sugar lactone lactonase YvrE